MNHQTASTTIASAGAAGGAVTHAGSEIEGFAGQELGRRGRYATLDAERGDVFEQ